MLMIYKQFITRYGVRSVPFLESPNVISLNEFKLPRGVVIHYLDQTVDNMFPNRNMYYFKELDAAKKIRIHQVMDLTEKKDTINLKNRFLPRDVKQWRDSHRKTFRVQDLFNKPNNDEHNTAVINYNTLPSLYNYASKLTSNYNKNINLIKTFADNLKMALDADKTSIHLVRFNIPTVIPGFLTIRRYMGFSEFKLSNIMHEQSTYWFFEWFKWLYDTPVELSKQEFDEDDLEKDGEEDSEQDITNTNEGTRKISCFRNITDEDSKRILLEVSYKGYAVYIPLSIFRGLSVSSKIDSTKKMNDIKTRKFFISYMFRLQNIMTGMGIVDAKALNNVEDDIDPEDYVDDSGEVETNPEDVIEKKEKKSNIVVGFNKTIAIDNKIFEFGGVVEDEDIFENLSKYDNEASFTLTDTVKGIQPIKKVRGDIKLEEKLAEETNSSEEDEIETNGLEVEQTPLTDNEKKYLLDSKLPEDIVDDFIEDSVNLGIMDKSTERSIRKSQEKRYHLTDPYYGKKINDIKSSNLDKIELKGSKVELPEISGVDATLLTDKIKEFDKAYVTKYLKTDVVNSVMNIENTGTIVTNYEVDNVNSSVDNYEIHRLELRPMKGKASSIYFRIPKVDKEGSFMVGGRLYRMRKLKQDLPIRKISPIRVALTTNYGKFFISRTERKAYDGDSFLIDFIKKDYFNEALFVKKVVPGKKRLNLIEGLPNDYQKLASEFNKVVLKDYTLVFNEEDKSSIITTEVEKDLKKKSLLFLGFVNENNNILVLDKNGRVIDYTTKVPMESISDLVGIEKSRIPKPFSVMKVLGLDIPLGVCLSYYFGISNLIKLTETKYRMIPSNKRLKDLKDNETELRFGDYRLVLTLDTEEKRLIFNGFNYYRDFIKMYNLPMFENKNIFLPLIEFRGGSSWHLKELECLDMLFVDPISKEVLKEMGEPTEYRRLLLRANEMLKDYSFPDINDPNFSRIRGYDRIAGLTYRALCESMREHHMSGRANSKINLDPYKVWNYITQDSSIQARESLNPVAYLKEDEIVTMTGRDGMSSGAVPKELRRFHPMDSGLFSESTSDSKDVALSVSLSPYAKIKNLRGLIENNYDELEANKGKTFSSTIQISPMSEYDD